MADESLDFSDFQESEEQSTDLLARISAAVSQWEVLSGEWDALEEQLAAKKGEIKFLAENLIPELMKEAQQKKLTSLGGFEVSVKEKTYGHVPAASAKEPDAVKRRWAAFKWLDENNFGHLITRKVEVTFDRAQTEAAKVLLAELREKGHSASPNWDLNHMRLQGFINECLEKGTNLPEDLFALRPYACAEAKGPNGKKLRLPKASDD
jgi:hypothetical protein